MKIGGVLKFSLIDYPGKISAVIFTQGCNFRCSYCHNPELVMPELFSDPIDEQEVLAFLQKRTQQIKGVVVTGGEPTLQKDLITFLRKIKEMGYLVKLDTNGSNPDVLKEVLRLNLVDYIAMDLKAPLEKYSQLTSLKNCAQLIQESIQVIIESGVDYEFRTTLASPIVPEDDLPQMVALISGAKKYRLQRFVSRSTLSDKELSQNSTENLSEQQVAELQRIWGIGGS